VTAKRKPRALSGDIPVRDYANEQTSTLLRRLAFQASRTAKLADVDAVHDLRVSIRRLTQCLRVFRQFFPRIRARKIQQKLEMVMDLASQVRDRDIALALLADAPPLPDSTLAHALAEERTEAERSLVTALQRWNRRSFHKRWRSRLGL
jgi:CHAD domain-containing protein